MTPHILADAVSRDRTRDLNAQRRLWHLQDCEARVRLALAGLADAKRARDTAWIELQKRDVRNARTALRRALKRAD